MNIDEYILKSKTMPNSSDGGSDAYRFEDVVLVKYDMQNKYGIARENEEKVAEIANKKRAQGVNTPYHYVIKRETDGEKNICWVLQEMAKGENFTKYASQYNKGEELILKQKILAEAPDYHYEKLVKDMCAIWNMGIEPKAKNIFYDSSLEDGGFTIVDLLEANEEPLNPEAFDEIYMLDMYVSAICNSSVIPSYREESEELKNRSKELYYKIKQRLFNAMEKSIPHFENHRRWLLRTYPNDILEYFEKNGTPVGDLSLTPEEYKEFDDKVSKLVEESLNMIQSGEKDFWDIDVNYIRIGIDNNGLKSSWIYHEEAKSIKQEDYDSYYDYKYALDDTLKEKADSIFKTELLKLGETTSDEYVLNAIDALKEKEKRYSNTK